MSFDAAMGRQSLETLQAQMYNRHRTDTGIYRGEGASDDVAYSFIFRLESAAEIREESLLALSVYK